MLSKLAARSTKKLLHWRHTGRSGLGIDIGQYRTKLAWCRPSQNAPPQLICASFPSGISTLDLCEAPAISASPQMLSSLPAADESDSRSSIRTNWSGVQLKHIARRIDRVVGGAYRLRRSAVNVAVSMSACELRSVYLPKETALTSANVHQALAEMTADRRQRCVAILPSTNGGGKFRTLSITEDLASGVAEKLDEVGLTPRRIDGLPWSLARALKVGVASRSTASVQVVLDWSFGSPTLIAVKQGNIDYVRCLAGGGLAGWVQQSALHWGFSLEEAVRWIEQSCLATCRPTQEVVEAKTWIRECCYKLAQEINTSIDFIRWRNQATVIDELWLTGGCANLPFLVACLQENTAAQLKVWSLDAPNEDVTPEYAVAASLALLGVGHA